MSDTLSQMLQQAIEITGAAAPIALDGFRGRLRVDIKADASPVTEADRATEARLRQLIAARWPQDGIWGEEHGTMGLDRARVWIIDPIDGTKSFVSGVPLFGMLLGMIENGRPRIGIVRLPALGECYAGAEGLGATLNGAPIRASGCTRLDEAILFVNEGERIFAADPDQFGRLCRAGRLRRLSYDCQPHALVAAGQIDAVVDCGLQPYDYLPLVALVEAAGGVICDWSGARLSAQSDGRVITAATPALRDQALALLAG